MSESKPMPESEPLTSEEVDALERVRDTWGSCETIWLIDSMERLIATIRDRERQLEAEAADHNAIQLRTERERDEFQRQLEAARKDTVRLDQFLWLLQEHGIDGLDRWLTERIWRPYLTFNREAIDMELRRIAEAKDGN